MVKKIEYGLNEAYGVEMEFMIVHRESLKIMPIADLLLEEMAGDVVADFENGDMAWSNELVLHVIEIKTNGPAASLNGLSEKFASNVKLANERLAKHGAMLLPSGAHPFMDPILETRIWPHENNEVYELYNRIFDCKGHGWSNLQSTHINLPFKNDEEFEKLHAAIRLLLPIIPALSASTPILDAKFNGFKDHRLEFYRKNQEKIPVIAGKVIPETAFSKGEYEKMIFEPIRQAIAPYDKHKILDKHFLNSRGAIARFDRMAIEIRIIDIQECPKMDIAILKLIDAGLQYLISQQPEDLEKQKAWSENDLSAIFRDHIITAEETNIANKDYLSMFGLDWDSCPGNAIWKFIAQQANLKLPEIDLILDKGTLSTRILKAIDNDYSSEHINKVYHQLAHCLAENQAFDPK